MSNENIATFERQQEWESVLAALDEELQKAKEQSRELKIKLTKNAKKEGFPPINLAIMDNEENLFQGMPLSPIKTESFDFGNNILEVKYLTLMDKDNKKTEIKDITFNIRKKGSNGNIFIFGKSAVHNKFFDNENLAQQYSAYQRRNKI